MKKITSYILFCLFVLILSGVTHAQNEKLIKFNNGGAAKQTEIQGNATIDINSGDITVQPVGNKLIIDEPANQKAIIGFYPSKYAINPNDTIDINWAVAFTDGSNCSASVPQGAALWSGNNKNGAPGVYSESNVRVTQLPATLRLTCNNYNGGSSYQEFDLVQAQSGGGTTTNPVINTFQLTSYPGANPTIPSDGSYNIQWNVSDLTGSCTATTSAQSHGGWTGTITNSVGNRNITIEGEPTLTLNCSNGGTQVLRSITITNSGGGGGNPSCTNALKPPGLTPVYFNWTDPVVGGTTVTPSVPDTNGFGFNFGDPGAIGVAIINYINPESSYIVMRGLFGGDSNNNIDRKLTFASSPGFGENGWSTMSISKCSGDFNPNTAQCVWNFDSFSQIRISNRPEVNQQYQSANNFCYVEKGETYFANFVFAPTYDGVQKNGILDGEECAAVVGNKCSIFWGEDFWQPYLP